MCVCTKKLEVLILGAMFLFENGKQVKWVSEEERKKKNEEEEERRVTEEKLREEG